MSHADTIHAYYAAWAADDLEAVREFLARFGKGMTDKRYDVQRILIDGDAAVVEGVENYVKGGKRISLPYMSTFLFRGALIREWRDYFDVQTVLRQRGLPLDGSRPPRSGAGTAGRAPEGRS